MNKKLLHLLLTKITKNKCLYILGSGVSINYAKSIQQTKSHIRNEIYSGSFLLEINNSKSDLNKLLTLPSNEIFSNESELILDLEWLYQHTTSNEKIDNLYLKSIQPNIPNECPEYEIFNLFKSGKIFNFNHDGLDELFIHNKNISILHPHGKFPTHAKSFLNSLHPMEYDYRLNLFNSWGIHPPTKENMEILHTKPYIDIKINFSEIEEIFIIGYSFCETQPGSIQDEYSFNLILDLAKFYRKRIWIINPNPKSLLNIMQENSHGQLEIIDLPIKWDFFTKAILHALGYFPLALLNRGSKIASMIVNNYKIPSDTPQSWLDLALMKLSNPSLWKFTYNKAYQEYISKSKIFTIDDVIKKYFELTMKNKF